MHIKSLISLEVVQFSIFKNHLKIIKPNLKLYLHVILFNSKNFLQTIHYLPQQFESDY